MRNILKAAALAASITLAAGPAFAQAAGSVLTVDIGRLYTDSAAGRSGTAQLKAKYEGQIQAAGNSFNSAATAYNAQVDAARKVAKPDGSLPPANQQSLAQAQQNVQNADRTLNRLQDEASAAGNYVQSQILERAVPIAEQIRAQRKAAIVLPRGGVLAADPATDVTASVIQSLDASLKTVSIVLPQQPAAAAGRPAASGQGR